MLAFLATVKDWKRNLIVLNSLRVPIIPPAASIHKPLIMNDYTYNGPNNFHWCPVQKGYTVLSTECPYILSATLLVNMIYSRICRLHKPVWQSRVEIQHDSVAYFDRITAFHAQ